MLDTATGTAAAGMKVTTRSPDGEVTNAVLDHAGRALLRQTLTPGEYQLSFHAGNYQSTNALYDVIPIWFTVTDPGAHHHIPLILSPYGYTTYRGT